jgi:hypothetical protein
MTQTFRNNAAWLGDLYASREFTEIALTWETGYVNAADGTIDPDPQVGLDSNHIWIHGSDGRKATRALLGDRMIPYRRIARQACSAGFNSRGEFTAIAPILGDAPGQDADSIAQASEKSRYIESASLTPGLVTAWSAGGYGLFVFVHPLPYRDTVITGAVDVSASVPSNPGEKRLVVIAYDVSDAALVAVDGAVTTALPDFTLQDVVAVDLGDSDRIRLGAVVLEEGQTDITSATRFIDARDWLSINGADGVFETLTVTNDTAASMVNINGDGIGSQMNIRSYNGSGSSTNTTANIQVGRAQGSLASPAAVVNGDRAGTIVFQAHSGAAMISSAAIIATVSDTPSGSNIPLRIAFEAVPDNTAAIRREYLGFGGTEIVFNDGSRAFNFRVESDTDANAFFIDGTNNRIGFFTGTPSISIGIGGNAARTVGMERHTTSNTAGNSLTLQSGGATSAATNKAAGALILATGVNTGNAIPAQIRLQAGVMNPTSGTGDNANVDRYMTGSKVLTDNSAITILNATLAAGTGIGGIIRYSIEVRDGTDIQVETGFAVYSGVNKAGAFTVSITEVSSQQDLSAGTLATTWAISGANPAAISVNANSSLTPSAGYPRISYSVENFAQQAIAAA